MISFAPTFPASFANINCVTNFTASPTKQIVYTNETTRATINYSGKVISCPRHAVYQLFSLTVTITFPNGTVTQVSNLPLAKGTLIISHRSLLDYGKWAIQFRWVYEVTFSGLHQFYMGYANSILVSKRGT